MNSAIKRMIPLLVLPLLICSCKQTQITQSWKKPEYQKQPFKLVLVAVLAPEPTYGRLFEQTFKDRLAARGIASRIAVDALPANAATLERGKLRELLAEQGFDSALVVSLTGAEFKTDGLDGRFFGLRPVNTFNSFDVFFPVAFESVQKTGHWSKEKTIFLEARFYSLGDEGLIWRAQSKTTKPEPILSFVEVYCGQVLKRLASDGIF